MSAPSIYWNSCIGANLFMLDTFRALFPSIIGFFIGSDSKMRRHVRDWAVSMLLYVVCMSVLAFGVRIGVVAARPALWLGAFMLLGVVLFYCLVRGSRRLGLTIPFLVSAQSVYAIGCIVAS